MFAIKATERSELLEVYFHISQPNWEICGNGFYISSWQVENCSGIVLKELDFQSRGPTFETTGWLQGQLSLSSFRRRSAEYQELLETWELNGKKETVSS